MKEIIKKIFALFGVKISRVNGVAVQKDIFNDAFEMQKYLAKDFDKELTIFDVGAYDGQTALNYKKLFPESKIFAFEPFPDSFSILSKAVAPLKDIMAINKGIGETEGVAKFNSNSSSATNSLLETDESGTSNWGKGLLNTTKKIEVELTTIDNFVEANDVKKIDLLKIDVQGAEYLVLKGAKKTIEKGLINMVYTEIITVPTYKKQLNFDEMVNLMRTFGFTLFNFYNSSITSEGQLRQVDAIFLKTDLIKKN